MNRKYKSRESVNRWKCRAAEYLVLFLIGYCIYLAIEVTYRGFSYRLMGLSGGAALMGIGILKDLGLDEFSLPVQMMVGAVLITALELYSGMYALLVLNVRMWDYRGIWMSQCQGLICPLFSFLWFLLSGVGIVVADVCDYYLFQGERRPIYRILGKKFALPERKSVQSR
ncbi:MAG: hypothetical protein ACI4EG_06600 [Fusicatenibacter sp.]|nr:putative ABC transporter permease [Fusicatenibacter sp.]